VSTYSSPRRKVSVLILLFLISLPLALAQSNRGAITGIVTDTSGAIIPNATVTAVETGTNTTYTAKSSQQGTFSFPQVLVGSYDITATAPSFQSQQQTGIQVLINTTSSIKFSLPPGDTSQTVTVTADQPSLESTSSEIGGVITSRQVIDLPLSLGGRTFIPQQQSSPRSCRWWLAGRHDPALPKWESAAVILCLWRTRLG
jgi:hypothetical protein